MVLPPGDRVAYQYPAQAAAAIGASVSLIVAAVNDGRLVTHQAGANKIVLRRDLEAFASALPSAPKAKTPKELAAAEADNAQRRAAGREAAEKILGKRK